MAGKKGSSPTVNKYYKIDGDKVTRVRKICSRCGNSKKSLIIISSYSIKKSRIIS
ncbi:MAG: hypothetical protein HYZ56_01220 [Nitrosopumilales archaeon]|nr:hypothetical protein [Nitrosopumilales archaeon]